MTASTQAYAALLALFLVAVLIGTVTHPRGQPQESVHVRAESTGLRIDVNTADAATLGLLPGVGPGIADHIIQARQGGAVFRSTNDLEAVKYIGPKLIARVGPWVAFYRDTQTGESAASQSQHPE